MIIRILTGVIAVLIAVWLIFTVLRAFSAFMHLALLIAVLVVAISLFGAMRRRTVA